MSRLANYRWTPLLLLLALCAFLFFYGINTGELWRTESLRAIVAAESLRSGNWVVPTLYGQPLLTKPPGMYASIALVSWPFGEVSEWTARLPSALAATATVFLFYWTFSRVLGSRAGLVAGLVLPISILWLDKAPSAEIDMLQVFWVAAAILFALRAIEDCTFLWWLAALLCVAGGFLTKWTAPAFFYLTVVPLLCWRRQVRLLFGWQHLTSAALAAGVCLAWAGAAIERVGWEEFSSTVSREALQRLSAGHFQETQQQLPANHQHKLPALVGTVVHPFAVLAMTLPWSALALLTFRRGFADLWNDCGKLLLLALHCWAWPNLLFWSLLPDHSPRYSLPLLPGISGLGALVCVAWLNGARLTRGGWCAGSTSLGALTRPRSPVAGLLIGVVALWIVVKFVYVEAVVPYRQERRELPRATAEQVAAAVPPGQTLWLCRVKDEGIMFYYGRPVRRLADFALLPSPGEPLFCMLEQSEWERGVIQRPTEAVLHLRDQQHAPIVLVKVLP
jgi:4-amino-4-deoxy-L-arabinose transferase-like glycosyltransferase